MDHHGARPVSVYTLTRLCLLILAATWVACGEAVGPAPQVDAAVADAGADLSLDIAPTVDVASEDAALNDAAEDVKDGPCVTDTDFFDASLWPSVLKPKCFGCHNGSGAAKGSKLVFRGETRAGALAYNREQLASVAAYEVNGVSIVLQKPLGQLGHGGGEVLQLGGGAHKLLQEFVERMDNPTPDGACDKPRGGVPNGGVFAGVGMLDAAATYRRAALGLAGRVPNAGETAFLEAAGDAGLPSMVAKLLDSELFLTRVAEHWNDRLLTDRYNKGADALYRLPYGEFPDRAWYQYDAETVAKKGIPSFMMVGAAGWSNTAVARAPLELIKHVVRHARPFTEILTADYMLVTPYSAWSYGVFDKVPFVNFADPTEWREVQLPNRPHVGILTSPMFLNRFPTTDTNRNRHRSRVVWDLFLATDVMALAERPIDPTEIVEHNPTMFNPDCSVCHTVIDPLAGLFQNWGAQGEYSVPKSGWFSDMLPPGFEAEKLPAQGQQEPLRWLATRIIKDPRFAAAIVRQAYEMVVGVPVVKLPSEEDDSLDAVARAARLSVYKRQQKDLEAMGQAFVQSKFDYKVLVTQVVMSPWFRAVKPPKVLPNDATEAALRVEELALLPGAQLLSPEALNRKLEAALGSVWRRYDKVPYLTHRDEYLIFYGGIDSDGVTRRIRKPNGLMAAVQERMANEAACLAVPFDFTKPAVDRSLFPFIEVNMRPYDDYGNLIPAAKDAIRETLRRLGWRLLGVSWKDGDPDLEELYTTWLDIQKTGATKVAAKETSSGLHWWHCRGVTNPVTGQSIPPASQVTSDPHYTMRAWMAVVALLMSDADFLYGP